MKTLSPKEIGQRYNQIARSFEENRSAMIGTEYLQIFLDYLSPKKNHPSPILILDIGCGTGLPLTKLLVTSGANVTGIDISSVMIEKARSNVPEATYIEGDILSTIIDKSFDGIFAWDSLFHLSLDNQERVIRKIVRLLNPKGVFLFTAGGTEGELVSMMFEAEFYYSSLSSEKYESILAQEDCLVILNEIDDQRSKGHRVIIAKKKE